MNTRPRPAPPGGVFHVAHMLTANDATTLTLNDAEQTGPPRMTAPCPDPGR
jgi:hypothetical protein